ncbi:MAG: hypothetical protein JRF33_10805 [Deltaproteobacteria bacterium]|nr:hypothetical protein [Deltaproteobacteria bacterium]
MTKYSAILLLTLLGSACVSMQPPEGYAAHEHWAYTLKAVSTEASVVALNQFRNQDEQRGTLAFWSEAASKHLVRSRGYAAVKEGDFTSPRGKGHWMLFSKRFKGTEHLYMLGLVLEGDKIFALEAGGEKNSLEPDLDRLVKSFATLD